MAGDEEKHNENDLENLGFHFLGMACESYAWIVEFIVQFGYYTNELRGGDFR